LEEPQCIFDKQHQPKVVARAVAANIAPAAAVARILRLDSFAFAGSSLA
jgi:hypothetical protein